MQPSPRYQLCLIVFNMRLFFDSASPIAHRIFFPRPLDEIPCYVCQGQVWHYVGPIKNRRDESTV